MPVEAGVQDQQIALLHLHALLDHLRSVDRKVAHLIPQVHDDSRTAEPFHRNLINRAAGGHEVPRCVEMGPHVIGGLDILRVDSML